MFVRAYDPIISQRIPRARLLILAHIGLSPDSIIVSIEEERQRQAIRDAYIKIINTTYDKASTYTNVIGASVRQRAPGGSGWTVCGEQA